MFDEAALPGESRREQVVIQIDRTAIKAAIGARREAGQRHALDDTVAYAENLSKNAAPEPREIAVSGAR